MIFLWGQYVFLSPKLALQFILFWDPASDTFICIWQTTMSFSLMYFLYWFSCKNNESATKVLYLPHFLRLIFWCAILFGHSLKQIPRELPILTWYLDHDIYNYIYLTYSMQNYCDMCKLYLVLKLIMIRNILLNFCNA